ncbi:MAG: hypothetical protein HOO06_12095 [Bdellovibrionaceae bacterium]|nr:hypothetical protein [Pseudobdellovibrionaceae bacterium]
MHTSIEKLDPRLSWMNSRDLRPYVLARKESRVAHPGQIFNLDWFPQEHFYMDPLRIDDVYFANALLNMEERAFASSGMAMPRWVFYDCAIMPGYISGFAHRTETLPQSFREILGEENLTGEWTPISMFIVIPTMVQNEWVAHNLSSMNALVPKEDRFYGLGFLSKAFGLSYGNIEICCGVTQWDSPAIRLHSHYGFFEILTAYTPAHSYAQTLTYRLRVNPSEWVRFFTHEESFEFNEKFIEAGFQVDPMDESNLIDFHRKIEQNQGPFYLDAREIRRKDLKENFTVYNPKY